MLGIKGCGSGVENSALFSQRSLWQGTAVCTATSAPRGNSTVAQARDFYNTWPANYRRHYQGSINILSCNRPRLQLYAWYQLLGPCGFITTTELCIPEVYSVMYLNL